MTDTDKREELIRVAAKRLYFDHSTEKIAETAPEIMALCEQFAEVTLNVFEQAYTPSDDEREAEAKRIWPVDREYSPQQTRAVFSVKELDAYCVSAFTRGAKWAAGFRRTAVQEPEGEPSCCDVPGGPERCGDCPMDREPQGEPTVQQIEDACTAFYEHATGLTSWARLADYDKVLANRYRDGMRRALRAAYETKGEGR